MKYKFAIIIFALQLSPIVQGKEYYVATTGSDSYDGSLASPWRHILHAARQAKPGDTLLVRGGHYPDGEIWIRADHGMGGSDGKYLTIKAYPGEEPIIDGPRRMIIDANYIRIEGLHFVNSQRIDAAFGTDHHHIEILNNKFTGNFAFGAIVTRSSDVLIEGNIIEVTGTAVGNKDHGIYIATGSNIVVRNNTVMNSTAYGIHLFEQRHSFLGDKPLAITNVLIEGNTVIGSQIRTGILLASEDGIEIRDVLIRNNVVTANNFHGILIRNGTNIEIYHNTIFANGRQGINIGDGKGDRVNNVIITNNIFEQQSNDNCTSNCSWYSNYHVDVAPLSQNVVVNNNLYWPPDIDNKGIADSNEIIADPLFTDASHGNFLLVPTSPAIDAGVDVGLPFVGPAPDLGAFEFGDETTDMKESGNQPKKFKLHQNYPNPFNPETKVVYEVFTPAHVRIMVYNLSGRLVKTLVNEEKLQQGSYETIWNGKNTQDEIVASGVYLYKIEVSTNDSKKSFSNTKKMILLH